MEYEEGLSLKFTPTEPPKHFNLSNVTSSTNTDEFTSGDVIAGTTHCIDIKSATKSNNSIELEEGQVCPDCKIGLLAFQPDGCSCHIHPPCSACENAELQCGFCGLWEEDLRQLDEVNNEENMKKEFKEGDKVHYFNQNNNNKRVERIISRMEGDRAWFTNECYMDDANKKLFHAEQSLNNTEEIKPLINNIPLFSNELINKYRK